VSKCSVSVSEDKALSVVQRVRCSPPSLRLPMTLFLPSLTRTPMPTHTHTHTHTPTHCVTHIHAQAHACARANVATGLLVMVLQKMQVHHLLTPSSFNGLSCTSHGIMSIIKCQHSITYSTHWCQLAASANKVGYTLTTRPAAQAH
jgi:hypothetical protein